MELKLIAAADGIYQVEIIGKLSRDEWKGAADPLFVLCGPDVYSSALLLNLSKSLYLDSTGVEWLLNYHKRFAEKGGKFVCHSASPATKQLLKIMKLDRVLHIELTEDAALAFVRNGKHD